MRTRAHTRVCVSMCEQNYHRAMATNDALRSDIEELQVRLAEVNEKAPPRARSPTEPLDGPMPPTRVFVVLENEQFFPLGGWSSQMATDDRWVGAGTRVHVRVGYCVCFCTGMRVRVFTPLCTCVSSHCVRVCVLTPGVCVLLACVFVCACARV